MSPESDQSIDSPNFKRNKPPKIPKRPTRYNIQPTKTRDMVFVHEKVTTGFFEDLFLSLLVWIERSIQNFRIIFLGIIQFLGSIRFRKMVRSIFSMYLLRMFITCSDIKSNFRKLFWALTFIWTTVKVLWWIIISPTKVPTGIRRVKQKLIQIQQLRIGAHPLLDKPLMFF